MSDDPADLVNVPLIVRMGSFTQTGVVQQILPADPTRLVLLVTMQGGTGWAFLYLRQATTAGFKFAAMGGIYSDFRWSRHGPLCQEALWTDASIGSAPISWMTLSRQ